MKIDDRMYSPGADVYYSKEFRDTLESHMDYFRRSSQTRVLEVDPHKANVYDGDLFGYLLYMKIQPYMHWVIMRVNNMYSPFDFGPGVVSLMIPQETLVEQLRQSQKSTGTGSIAL